MVYEEQPPENGDNSEGLIGLVNETQQQKQAMEYFDYIIEKNNYHKEYRNYYYRSFKRW